MLNLREALAAFPQIPDERWIYRWVDERRLHAVMLGKRWHYPDWELEELTNGISPNPSSFEFGALLELVAA